MAHRALSLVLLAAPLFVTPASGQRSGGFATGPASRAAAPIGAALPRGGPVRARIVRMHRGRTCIQTRSTAPVTILITIRKTPANRMPSRRKYHLAVCFTRRARACSHIRAIQTCRASRDGTSRRPLGPPYAVRPPGSFQLVGPALRSGTIARFTAPSSERSVLPPAVLVFRDGHQEEAAQYTIIGKTISIKSDYWTTGSWTHTSKSPHLDLPATLQANQSRGSNFRLPSRPTEVILR